MARKLRIQYPGAIYHVMNRGDRREPIFCDDSDRLLFLQTFDEVCDKTGWQIHALCLMTNHFHFVPETPQANLVEGMHWLLSTYTNRFNRRHKLVGQNGVGPAYCTLSPQVSRATFNRIDFRCCGLGISVAWPAGYVCSIPARFTMS